jgi:CHAD domain-containing protein
MFRTRTPAELLDQQASLLAARLTGVHDGDVNAVHDARIATRRIRELLALVPLVPGRDPDEDPAVRYKEVGRALGRVRDIDVKLALIRDLEAHAPQTARSLVVVRQEHECERLAKMRRLIKTLERVEIDGLRRAITTRHASALRAHLTSTGWRQQLRHLLCERAQAAVERIDHATGVYFPNRIHKARIAIKQLRYAAEIAEGTSAREMAAAIKSLNKSQGILGDLHDRQSLADTLATYSDRDDVEFDQVRVAGQVLDGEVLELHARYLARRPALLEACASIRRAAAPESWTRPVAALATALALSGVVYTRRRFLPPAG